MLKLAADIGGTFTDIVVEEGERRWSVKIPTTHQAPDEAVVNGVRRALAEAGRPLEDVGLFVHGTTLATNALIERKGARTGLLTTDGFRDVLEIGNEGRFDQYDLHAVKPTPIVERRLRFTARERLRHDGSIVVALDIEDVRRAAGAMIAADVEAVAISFLHAYANGDHEAAAAEILRQELGPVPISLSHQVSPEIREYERTSTTCANAYLQPVVSSYLLRLQSRLQEGGLTAPMLMILSSGSLASVETASRFPIRLLESGPAGGAIFACEIARRLGADRVLSFDVGGTTAKFCMIDDGKAHHALSFEVGRTYRFKKGSGLPVRVPVVDLVEIGAGGGSIARIDSVGRVAVGPDSAGSEPGPACYGRGGAAPTVTDCDLLLGKLDGPTFAGGDMPLDTAASSAAVARDLSESTGLSIEGAAYAVTETMTETMAAAARVHAAEIGTDIEARTLIAFGGGAPLQAARFAQKLGIDRIIIPAGAGVGSAIGFLRAPLAFEVVRTARLLLPDGDLVPARTALAAMREEAQAIVADLPGADRTIIVRSSAHMRYVGQGHEIEVNLPVAPEEDGFAKALYDAFASAYRTIYGRAIEGGPAEVMAWSVQVQRPSPPVETIPPLTTRYSARPIAERSVFNGLLGSWETWPVFDRAELLPGASGHGPAILAEAETTSIVPAGFEFAIDAARYAHIVRETK